VVNVARHEWLVTDGDQVGDASVATVADRGVFVRRANTPPRARPVLARFRAPTSSARAGAGAAVRPQPPPLVAPRLGPIRIPQPPEPPATP
jgi:hypothetical protein